MVWVFVALIIGSLVYIGLIVVEYTHVVLGIKPMTSRLLARAMELEDAVGVEFEEIGALRRRIEGMRPGIGHLHEAIVQARKSRDVELVRQQRLEMATLKNRLRSIPRTNTS